MDAAGRPASDLEASLIRRWFAGVRGALRTADGRQVEVVFRGRCPGGGGPDVRDALLAFDGSTLLQGDVEFHRRSTDWFSHGHQGDRRYDGVILHVVLVDDASTPATDSMGRRIPPAIWHADPEEEIDDRVGAPVGGDGTPTPERCHGLARRVGPEAIRAVLDDLGDRRFAQRAARVEAELECTPDDQVAFALLMDALGFSRNRGPFVQLAELVPFDLLAARCRSRAGRDAIVLCQATLLGVAGLLPSQRSPKESKQSVDWSTEVLVDELEAIWSLYRDEWAGLCLTDARWTFGGVRPTNYPPRRLAAAAILVQRFSDRGIAAALVDGVIAAGRPTADPLTFARTLVQPIAADDPAGYWASHADFGVVLPRTPSALVGADRAADVVINVVLPFALAVAARRDDGALADAAWRAYRAFPRLAENVDTRTLAVELGGGKSSNGGTVLARSARQQQGLIHLRRTHCDRSGGFVCPLADQLRAWLLIEGTLRTETSPATI